MLIKFTQNAVKGKLSMGSGNHFKNGKNKKGRALKRIAKTFCGTVIVAAMLSACEFGPDITASFEVTYAKEFENVIYPSFISSLAKMETHDELPPDYFRIVIEPDYITDVRIVVNESPLNYETVVSLRDVEEKTVIIPQIKWKYDELLKLDESGTVNLLFTATSYDTEIGRQTVDLTYKSINECVFALARNGSVADYKSLLAGYVNENSTMVEQLLDEVLAQNPSLGEFRGYAGDEQRVMTEVSAIFETLRKKGFKYGGITANSANQTSYVASRFLLFPDETLSSHHANCADATALICSCLQKIGIESLMIYEPGHAYLGFYAGKNEQSLKVLETMAIGISSYTFDMALRVNSEKFNENKEKFDNTDVMDGYFYVDVAKARKIIPSIEK